MQHETRSALRPDAAASDHGPANVALKQAVARLSQLLDRETSALRTHQRADMDDLCHRKNQALLELSRIGRQIDGEAVDSDLRSMVAELRDKLDENRAVIQLHLQAVGEVADILATAIRDAESDGTYSTGMQSRWQA